MDNLKNAKLEEAKTLLKEVGMPKKQQNDMSAYTLLALAKLKPESEWSEATKEWSRIVDIRNFLEESYDKIYAMNTRESIRKNALRQFREAALIIDDGKDTNSPTYSYRFTDEALTLIQSVSTNNYESELATFIAKHEKLIDIYKSKKEMAKLPVHINSTEIKFSPGPHNELQKAIIEEFAPRFAPNAKCLYVGDTTKRDLIKDVDKLNELGFEITLHDKMPDVVLYREDKKWIYFIEAVVSDGPMSPQRIIELNKMTTNVTVGKVFITAFLDFSTYKKHSSKLAWETEVWISELPEHMIHLNGDKFLGPRK